jgi:hypothetical protein
VKKQTAKKIFRLLKRIAELMGESGGNSLRTRGRRWEKKFSRLASDRGFLVDRVESKGLPYDTVVNGTRVQCKCRSPLKNGSVDLCLARRKGNAKKAYLVNDFNVLALRCKGLTYLIPVWAITHKDARTIKNNIKPNDYACFVDNWGVFSGVGEVRQVVQMKLPFSCQ